MTFLALVLFLNFISPWTLGFAYYATKITDPEILTRFEALSQKTKVGFTGVYKMEFPSKRVANAMVCGLFPRFRRVYLADAALEALTPDEVESLCSITRKNI